MKWKFLLILSIICFSCKNSDKNSSNFTSTTKDSTAIWIETAKKDKSLAKSERMYLLDRASELIDGYSDNSIKTSSLLKLSTAYQKVGDTLSFRKKNQELIALAKKTNDLKSHGEAHWDLGRYLRNHKPDSAVYHYREAYALFLNADLDSSSKDYPGRILFNSAMLKDKNKDHTGAEKDIVNAINFFKENNLEQNLFIAYNILAVIQNSMRKYDKALEYHKKAKEYISFSKENRRFGQRTTNLNNLASTNLRKGDYEEAIEYYRMLLDTDSLLEKRKKLYAKALTGLAYARFKNGYNNYAEITDDYLKSNQILDSLNNVADKARNHEYYAELLAKIGEIDLAVKNASIAKNIADQTGNNDRLLSSLKLLTVLDNENSAEHGQAYFNLNESLLAKERAMQDKFARIELETDEVIEENVSLAKQRETLIGLAIGLLLLGLGLFVIINQRANNEKLRFQQRQQESNQEIYNLMLSQQGKFQEGKQLEQKRISEEIHDGILGQMLGIRLILSGLNERSDESAMEQRAELIDKLQELEEEIRTISHELNSAAYKKINNYIIAIEDLIKTVSSSSTVDISFKYTDTFDWDNLDGDIKINTYRIAQECLQNCIKHSKCNNISVNLNCLDNKIELTIVDDGIGFNVRKGKRGIGLKNITSRVEKINGVLKIESELRKGTEMKITVPLKDSETANKTEKRKALEA